MPEPLNVNAPSENEAQLLGSQLWESCLDLTQSGHQDLLPVYPEPGSSLPRKLAFYLPCGSIFHPLLAYTPAVLAANRSLNTLPL